MNDNFLLAARQVVDAIQANQQPDSIELAKIQKNLELILNAYNKSPPSIAETSADFYTLLLQLREYVKREDTWKDFYVASTGMTILELIAAIGAFLQNSIHVAFRESFSETASRASSVYAATRFLGVKIDRKTPAKVKVWLKRASALQALNIPPYTQFIVGGLEFFNTDAIRFPIGEGVLPITVGFDQEGKAIQRDTIKQAYLAQIEFPESGQVYYPCKGKVIFTHNSQSYQGTISIDSDLKAPNSALGTIHFDAPLIVPSQTEFKVYLSQYTGETVTGNLKFNFNIFLRFPATLTLQIRRTGAGASFFTPTSGTISIPVESAIISNESSIEVQDKYLKPEYLNRPITVYDNDLFLYSGRVTVVEHTVLSHTEFYSFALDYPGFNVSNDHLYIEVFDGSTSRVWTKATDNSFIKHGPLDQVYTESTLGNGDCFLTFGNGVQGMKLESGWIVGVRFVLTKGQAGNNGSAGDEITCSGFDVIGQTLTAPYGGSDEKSPAYYKTMGSSLYRANNRAVTYNDHESILLTYPNVADVAVLSQKDFAPYDLRFMNRLSFVLLPKSPLLSVYPSTSLRAAQVFDGTIVDPADSNDPNIYRFSELELLDLSSKFKKVAFSALDLDFFCFPIPSPIRVKIRAFIYRQYGLDSVATLLSQQIKSLFSRGQGILGRSLMLADLTRVCHISEVDYIEVLLPSSDLILTDSIQDKSTFFCLADNPEILTEYTGRR